MRPAAVAFDLSGRGMTPEQRRAIASRAGGFWNKKYDAFIDHDPGEHDRANWERSLRDVELARAIGTKLEQEFKGHHFLVRVDSEQGIAHIGHTILPSTWGIVIHLKRLVSDPGMKCVRDAGGEILTRLEMPRSTMRTDLYRETAHRLRRVTAGIFDVSINFKTGEVRRHIPQVLAR